MKVLRIGVAASLRLVISLRADATCEASLWVVAGSECGLAQTRHMTCMYQGGHQGEVKP